MWRRWRNRKRWALRRSLLEQERAERAFESVCWWMLGPPCAKLARSYGALRTVKGWVNTRNIVRRSDEQAGVYAMQAYEQHRIQREYKW